eukprot:4127500-Amphidinium_carterae.1
MMPQFTLVSFAVADTPWDAGCSRATHVPWVTSATCTDEGRESDESQQVLFVLLSLTARD